MSSYICDALHFNSCEQGLISLIGRHYWPHEVKQLYPEFLEDSHKDQARRIAAIFDAIRELSARCVTLQYRHHFDDSDAEIRGQIEILKAKKRFKPLDVTGIYKALICLNYQIETHHLEALRPLTTAESQALTFLRVMIHDLAHEIATGTPEYKAAQWSLRD